jgi:hypothetical protein
MLAHGYPFPARNTLYTHGVSYREGCACFVGHAGLQDDQGHDGDRGARDSRRPSRGGAQQCIGHGSSTAELTFRSTVFSTFEYVLFFGRTRMYWATANFR